jgi:DNA-binding NarL/FixJ family response regulator
VTISVLIVDDQALVREGLRMIVDAEQDLEVIGEAADGIEAVEAAKAQKPDIVLMDIRMPRVDGLQATRRLIDEFHAPPRVIILTTFELDDYVYSALQAGASGFLLKDVRGERLVAGIRAVAAGESLLAPSITRRMIESFVSSRKLSATPPPALAELTPREREVFDLMVTGLSNAEIAERLVVAETTVKTHCNRVLMKLGLRDRVQAVILAYESGLVD